jgi:hypothetical protein
VITNGSVECQLGELAVSGTVQVQLSVRADRRGVFHHLAQVEGAQPDPDLRDNRSVSSTLVVDATELVARKVEDNQVEISWPSATTGFVLQYKDGLGNEPWTTVNLVPMDTNGWSQVKDVISSRYRLYRLYRE